MDVYEETTVLLKPITRDVQKMLKRSVYENQCKKIEHLYKKIGKP